MNSYILSQTGYQSTVYLNMLQIILSSALGNGKKGVAIILAVLADGSELLPHVIFNHKTMSKDQVHSGAASVV
jgi:hypothetical protein